MGSGIVIDSSFRAIKPRETINPQGLLLGSFHADVDVYRVAEPFSRPDAEVLALDRQTAVETGLLHTLHIEGLAAVEREGDRFLSAVHAEIAGNFVAVLDRLNIGALERYERILFRVEEIGAAQVVVTLLDSRVDAIGFNGKRER